MQRIQLNEDILSLSEFRGHISAFIEKIHKTKRPLVITQQGKGKAVLLDVAEYEALIEKLELLNDIQTGEMQVRQARTLSHEEAKKQVLERISK